MKGISHNKADAMRVLLSVEVGAVKHLRYDLEWLVDTFDYDSIYLNGVS